MIDQDTLDRFKLAQGSAHANGTSLAYELDTAGLLFTAEKHLADRLFMLAGIRSCFTDWTTAADALAKHLPPQHQALTAASVVAAVHAWIGDLIAEGEAIRDGAGT